MATTASPKRRRTTSKIIKEPDEDPPQLNQLVSILSIGPESAQASEFWKDWCFRSFEENDEGVDSEDHDEHEWTTDYYKKDASFSDSLHVRLLCHNIRHLDLSRHVPDRTFTDLVSHKRIILLFVPLNTNNIQHSLHQTRLWKVWLDQHAPLIPTSLVGIVDDDDHRRPSIFWVRLGAMLEKLCQELDMDRFYLWNREGNLDTNDGILRQVVEESTASARDELPRAIAVSPSSTISTRTQQINNI